MKLSRRSFIRLGLLAGLAGFGIKGCVNARDIELEKVEIRLDRLPPDLDGLRIGQITDLHAGPLVSAALIREGVDLLMTQEPDLIVLTGDFISGATKFLWTSYGGFKEEYLDYCAAELARLEAPLGLYGVLGNHDFWSGPREAEAITRGLAGIGVRMLRNEAVQVKAGRPLFLSGVDDYWSDSYKLSSAVKPVPAEACHILLSHNPDVNEDAGNVDQEIDLIISGHTHGGQIVLPLIGAPYLPSSFGQKYRQGLVRDGRRQTYVSRGLGLFFAPIRLNCPPDVSLLTLKSGGLLP
ncbi:MAG: metallophosphoesterase [Thermodesulfobacteriota bacterium]